MTVGRSIPPNTPLLQYAISPIDCSYAKPISRAGLIDAT
jgi:hypothetical protein